MEIKEDDTPVTAVDREAERIVRKYSTTSAAPTPSTARSTAPRAAAGAAVDHRPRRRHQELHPRHPRVGHADRPRGRAQARRGRRERAGARRALVRGQGRRRVEGHQFAPRGANSRLQPRPARRHAFVFLALGLGGARHAARLPRTHPSRVAYQGVWRFLELHDGRGGLVDVACEPDLALYDMAALVPIVEEAGGVFTSLAGVPGPFGADAVATNGVMHTEVLGIIGTADVSGQSSCGPGATRLASG